MPFSGFRTYYRIAGKKTGGRKPLVLLHGGPGSTHNYFEVLDKLAAEDGRELVMYDQFGCGRSCVEGHPELWTAKTWIEELAALRDYLGLAEIHLLGQSWGGMQLLDYVCNYKPLGLKSLILSSTLPSSQMWGLEQHRLLKLLPQEMQDAIDKALRTKNYDDPDYARAVAEYMRRHAAEVTAESPECVRRPKKSGQESYLVAWGPNEFTPEGTLKDFDVTEQLKDIREPTLVIDGGNDLCTPYIAKFMYDRIPNARWELFRDCRHMCFVEDNARYVALLKEWLNAND